MNQELNDNLEKIRIAKTIDTTAVSWYLYPERKKHGLAVWGEELGIAKPEVEDWDNLSIEEYIHRCTEDVKINAELYNHMLSYLKELYSTHLSCNNIFIYGCIFNDVKFKRVEVNRIKISSSEGSLSSRASKLSLETVSVKLFNSSFVNCILTGSYFNDKTSLHLCSFKNVDMEGVRFTYTKFNGCNFDSVLMENNEIDRVFLFKCSFHNMDFYKLELEGFVPGYSLKVGFNNKESTALICRGDSKEIHTNFFSGEIENFRAKYPSHEIIGILDKLDQV